MSSDVYVFRYDASGSDFDGDGSHVEHVSSDERMSKYRWTAPSEWFGSAYNNTDRQLLEVLVVGGGGGGGKASSTTLASGGGGGGGVVYSRSIPCTPHQGAVDVLVGNGGENSDGRSEPRQGPGFNGHHSCFGPSIGLGGGGGGSTESTPGPGGSGGGGQAVSVSNTPLGGQALQSILDNVSYNDGGASLASRHALKHMGFPGGFHVVSDVTEGPGAGGGGANAPGGGVESSSFADGRPGGEGFSTDIEQEGTFQVYGAGGGGGRRGSEAQGGKGGGTGRSSSGAGDGGAPDGEDALSSRGGGGGGGGTHDAGQGGKGGSGVVVVRLARVRASDLRAAEHDNLLTMQAALDDAGLSGRIGAQLLPDLRRTTHTFADEFGGGKGVRAIAVSGLGTIVAAQGAGRLSRSVDGGDSWAEVHDASDADVTMRDVLYIPDVHAFYAVGHKRTLLRSLDDGQTWTDIVDQADGGSALGSEAVLDSLTFGPGDRRQLDNQEYEEKDYERDVAAGSLEIRGSDDGSSGHKPFALVSHDFGARWSPKVDLTRPSHVSFYIFPGPGSEGGGVRLLNENNDTVAGFSFNSNGEWNYVQGSTIETLLDGIDGRGAWIYITFDIDWGQETYDITAETVEPNDDGEQRLRSGSGSLANASSGAPKIALSGYAGGSWTAGLDLQMWVSDIEVGYDVEDGDGARYRVNRSEPFASLDRRVWDIPEQVGVRLFDDSDNAVAESNRGGSRPGSGSPYTFGRGVSGATQNVNLAVASLARFRSVTRASNGKKKLGHHFVRDQHQQLPKSIRFVSRTTVEVTEGSYVNDVAAGSFSLFNMDTNIRRVIQNVDSEFPALAYLGVEDDVLEMDLSTFRLRQGRKIQRDSTTHIRGIVVSPDGKYLYLASENTTVYRVNRAKMTVEESVRIIESGRWIPSHTNAIVISGDGRRLYVGENTGRVHEIRAPEMEIVPNATFDPGNSESVTALTLSNDARYLFVGQNDGRVSRVRLWHTRGDEVEEQGERMTEETGAVSVNTNARTMIHDRGYMFVGGQNGKLFELRASITVSAEDEQQLSSEPITSMVAVQHPPPFSSKNTEMLPMLYAACEDGNMYSVSLTISDEETRSVTMSAQDKTFEGSSTSPLQSMVLLPQRRRDRHLGATHQLLASSEDGKVKRLTVRDQTIEQDAELDLGSGRPVRAIAVFDGFLKQGASHQ